MNTMEFNKVFGAVTASILVFLLAGLASEAVFSIQEPAQPGFSVEIETAGSSEEAAPEEDFAALLAAADPAAGAAVFRKCAACHKIEDGANGVGPHLYGVVGREVDSVEGFAYSGALEQVAQVWGFDELNAFLENPKGYAPGTKMGFAGLAKATERAAVIAYLNEAGGSNLPLPERAEAAPAANEIEEAAAPAEEAAAEETVAAVSAPAEATEAPGTAEAAAMTEAPEATAAAETPAPDTTPLLTALAAADPAQGEKVFRKCAACHKAEEGRHGIGPSLWGVVGREVASAENYTYSEAMRAKGGTWTFAVLSEYLEDPRGVVPGMRMSFAGLPELEDRAAVIVFLNEVTGAPLPLSAALDAASPSEVVSVAVAADAAEEGAAAAPEVEAEPVEAVAESAIEVAAAPETAEPETAEPEAAAAGADAFAAAYAAADPADGQKVFRKCGACHKLEEGRNGVGPSLWAVVGRDIAAIDGFKYSDALKAHDGEWDPRTLSAFIENPKAWAPGTKMSFAGLAKIEERAALIKYLNEAGGSNLAVQ